MTTSTVSSALRTYRIIDLASGGEFGLFDGETEAEALLALVADAHAVAPCNDADPAAYGVETSLSLLISLESTVVLQNGHHELRVERAGSSWIVTDGSGTRLDISSPVVARRLTRAYPDCAWLDICEAISLAGEGFVFPLAEAPTPIRCQLQMSADMELLAQGLDADASAPETTAGGLYLLLAAELYEDGFEVSFLPPGAEMEAGILDPEGTDADFDALSLAIENAWLTIITKIDASIETLRAAGAALGSPDYTVN